MNPLKPNRFYCITYEIVTPESAEDGEYSEAGYTMSGCDMIVPDNLYGKPEAKDKWAWHVGAYADIPDPEDEDLVILESRQNVDVDGYPYQVVEVPQDVHLVPLGPPREAPKSVVRLRVGQAVAVSGLLHLYRVVASSQGSHLVAEEHTHWPARYSDLTDIVRNFHGTIVANGKRIREGEDNVDLHTGETRSETMHFLGLTRGEEIALTLKVT